VRTLALPSAVTPLRLDMFLARQVPGCSRRDAQRAIAAGAVQVNGHPGRKGDFVHAGDQVQVAEEVFAPPVLQPNFDLVVPVLYEDDVLIAVDKPAGMPSQALHANESRTVANFLLAHDASLAGVGNREREAGLVHRLDSDTSGVLLAARTVEAYRALRQQFSQRQVLKQYVVLVEGKVVAPGAVREPLVHDKRDRRKMRVTPEGTAGARDALTYYQPKDTWAECTLLAVRIPTGVMHQIRVHLASIGHPVVGDHLYGRANSPAPRQLLHAAQLRFVHPVVAEPRQITSPLPADFAGFLATLKRAGRRTRRAVTPAR